MEAKCSDFHEWINHTDSDICVFIRNTSDCSIDDGFINYLELLFCNFTAVSRFVGVIIEISWWLLMFIALAKTADNFFCPNLTVLAKLLRCSDSFAGVTLVAFGNGSPDIFSALSAVLVGGKNDELGLAFGALLGAGIFVTTIVVGVIAVVNPFKTAERPLLKDLVFYIGVVFWVFCIFYKGNITFLEAIGFLIVYCVYVIITIVGRLVYIRNKSLRIEINAEFNESIENPVINNGSVRECAHLLTPPRSDHSSSGYGHHHFIEPNYMAQWSIDHTTGAHEPNDDTEKIGSLSGTEITLNLREKFNDFLQNLNPICLEDWPDMNKAEKIFHCVQAVVVLPLTIFVPVVDTSKNKENWQKYLILLQCLITPVMCGFLIHYNFVNLTNIQFPVWGLLLILSFLLMALVHFTSRYEAPPRYHHLISIAGFVVSVMVIYSVANEIVNLLKAFGVFFYLPSIILGLTLLALGNSVGDLFSDYALAKGGRPRMALSACFGGPLFNLLLGVGLPFSIQSLRLGGVPISIPVSATNYILVGFLEGSLIFTLLFVMINKFYLSKVYGIVLLVIYGVFLLCAIIIGFTV